MATTTTTVPGTAREPRIALGVALHRPRSDRASIADVAAALNVLTAVIGEQDDAPPLDIPNAHVRSIRALAVVEDDDAPLIISASAVGELRSWRLDGTSGELEVSDAHTNGVRALAIVEDDGAVLIISAGGDGALRSWRLNGTPGPLQVRDAHVASMVALTVVENRSAPLIISGGGSDVAALRSWRLEQHARTAPGPRPASRVYRGVGGRRG
jgi:WD40 repeat protein